VLTLTGKGVSHVSTFFDLTLFEKFGLPEAVTPRKTATATQM
jgi:hypothetical protein